MTARDAGTPSAVTVPRRSARQSVALLRNAWRHPLERNALAMMSGTVTTALIGVLFWTAAAHFYETSEVGRASAVISTAAFLGNLSHLNLGNVFARFLPAAGARTPVLVRRGMLATAALGLVLGSAFVLLWQTEDLFTSPTERALFPLCVAVLTVFTLQDPLLVGLRAATWVPVKNLSFSIAKLLVLVALAGLLPRGGLVAAWVVPAAVALVVVVLAMRRTVVPRHVDRSAGAPGLPPTRELVGYAGGELATGLMIYIVPMVLPLIIVGRLGDEANAYFAIPYVISSALTMLTWNVAVSFVVEAANDEARTRALTRRSLRLSLLVAAASSVVLLIGADVILSIFGDAYASHGALLLRLMALAAPATVVTTVYTSVLRVRRRVGWVVVIQVLVGSAVITASAALIGRFGVSGVGIAYLSTEGLVGLVLLVPLLRSIRDVPPPAVPAPWVAVELPAPVPHPREKSVTTEPRTAEDVASGIPSVGRDDD